VVGLRKFLGNAKNAKTTLKAQKKKKMEKKFLN
jgi:hypothetical protein